MTKSVAVLVALAATLTLAACGSSETKTVVTVIKEAAPAATSDSTSDAPDSSSSVSEADSSSDSSSTKITVPDVVGMDHQDAQNKMQDVGLYNLDEEDATGQGRMLIIDHNWEVVRQKPAAGSKVSEDTTILLISKKKGE
jgi:FlaG/FlaF family flagellin (archaellin)